MAEPAYRPAESDDELARIQQAITAASDDWVQAHEAEVPFDPPPEGMATDYGQFAPIISQTPEQLADYWTAVEAAAAATAPGGDE